MEIFKIIGIGFIAVSAAAVLKPQRPDISMQVTLAAGIIIFILMVTQLAAVVDLINVFAQKAGIKQEFLGAIIKITGIAYITEFASSICKDAGESSVAFKIEFAGRIIIMVLAIPILGAVLNLLVSVMP